jgi:hypothetical protein
MQARRQLSNLEPSLQQSDWALQARDFLEQAAQCRNLSLLLIGTDLENHLLAHANDLETAGTLMREWSGKIAVSLGTKRNQLSASYMARWR